MVHNSPLSSLHSLRHRHGMVSGDGREEGSQTLAGTLYEQKNQTDMQDYKDALVYAAASLAAAIGLIIVLLIT